MVGCCGFEILFAFLLTLLTMRFVFFEVKVYVLKKV